MGKGPNVINQDEHLDAANARKVTEGVIIPGDVKTDDASAAGVYVGKGNICRIEVTADTYVAFGADAIGAVDSSTSPASKLKSGISQVVATDDYIRSSAALTRLEVIAK